MMEGSLVNQPLNSSGRSMDAMIKPGNSTVSPANQKKKNIIIRGLDKVAAALGFKKTYNVVLWFMTGAAMIGFVLARLNYIKIHPDHLAPGQWYWYHRTFYKVGWTLHLAAILPAGILCVFQFIPIIRYKWLMLHRINGYIVYLLILLGAIGGIMLTRRTLGGAFGAQLANVVLGLMTVTSAILAYYNIKRLQIDQHRKWMLRCIFYMASIITDRILNFALVDILFLYLKYQKYFVVWECQELAFTLNQYGLPEEYLAALYPSCLPEANGPGFVAVQAALGGTSGPEMIGSAHRWSFSGTLFWGMWIHAIAVEIYIRLTPGEDNRLREYSYQRQLEAGNTKNPGNAGTTRDRLGDAGNYPFEPKSQNSRPESTNSSNTVRSRTVPAVDV